MSLYLLLDMKTMFEYNSCCDDVVETSELDFKMTLPHFGELQWTKWAIEKASDADCWGGRMVRKDLSGGGQLGVEHHFWRFGSLSGPSRRDFAFENHGEFEDKKRSSLIFGHGTVKRHA